MVITRRGIVATSQTLASQAGAQVLARGGSAMDAAIAANAVLGVVEPMSNGMGGDLFAIHRDGKTGKLSGMNASGPAPKALDAATVKKAGLAKMPELGIHTVTVPGCVDGWQRLHERFGKLPWADLFRPAILYARDGFPVTEWIHTGWSENEALAKLRTDANARRISLFDGRAPAVGELFKNAELARALEVVARDGPKGFYRGAIAKAILATSRRLGGTLSEADMASYESEWVQPISTTYRGWTVYELPPNGQGMAALEMLNIMERFPLASHAPLGPQAFHIRMEAQKLAYADLERYLGDPRFGPIPSEVLVSKSYAAKRAASIKMETAECAPAFGNPIAGQGDTIYLSAVDSDGNVVSLIQSLYKGFGTGIVVDDFGFHLHNRGALFTLDAGHPNELKPGKRPFHTIIPAYMEKDHLHVGFGIMGGLNQAQAHAQFVSYMLDHEMNIQQSLEAPRFTKLTFTGCDFQIENRVPAETREALRAKGHKLEVLGEYSSVMGGGQVVMHDAKAKMNYGASSPRKDGAAIPEPDAYFRK